MEKAGSKIGFTSTVPVEAILACGGVPVDLNNVFVSNPGKGALLELSHEEGFPQGCCAWLKGIYGAIVASGEIDCVIGVVRGDCSGTEILLQALEARGVEVIPFSYPYPRDERALREEMKRLCSVLGTSMPAAAEVFESLMEVRSRLYRIDELCWKEGKVSGLENHSWLVSGSDFRSDPERFSDDARAFINEAERREPLSLKHGTPFRREVRLGYVGVPPVNTEIFELVEMRDARFVFHETQRQFAMLPTVEGELNAGKVPGCVLSGGREGIGPASSVDRLVRQYLRYTYPYTLKERIEDIREQALLRRLDGLVHYVQSFCYRNMEDVLFSRAFDLPFITVECDCPGEIGAQTRLRLENFIHVIGENIQDLG